MTKQSEGIKGTGRKTGDAILDEHTGAVVTITCEHAMIHESNAWKFSVDGFFYLEPT